MDCKTIYNIKDINNIILDNKNDMELTEKYNKNVVQPLNKLINKNKKLYNVVCVYNKKYYDNLNILNHNFYINNKTTMEIKRSFANKTKTDEIFILHRNINNKYLYFSRNNNFEI